ncbi:hypothetical protein NG783_10460 [Aliarcobacter cryaerophilus]|uniref:hypothetical protein n=1 Tax=Aliarcobacter cryaerophilus TaxID=28198 RepID=UPI003DA1DA7B
MAKSGLARYLIYGNKKESEFNRDEKDMVLSLYGNLETFEKAENYCMEAFKWKNNYEHLTVSFNKEDEYILSQLNQEQLNETLKEISEIYIKHRTSGYDLENEVIAVAEAHFPKIKFENGKERLPHLHIGISYLNPLSNTQLRTTFYNNSYISDVLDKYVAKKYGLTYIENTNANRKKPDNIKDRNGKDKPNQIETFRKKLSYELRNFKSKKEIEDYLTNQKLKWKYAKNKIKVFDETTKEYINLRGKGLENVEKLYNPKFEDKTNFNEVLKKINNSSAKELEDILHSYYEKRIELINDRRNATTKNFLEKLYEVDKKLAKENSFKNFSLQEKIFYKHYKSNINEVDLKGYYINTKDVKNVKFSNKYKNINIVDNGNEITSLTKSKNLQEEVALMIKIAEAKKWNLADLEIIGEKDFIREAEKQIAEKLREKNKIKESYINKDEVLENSRSNSEIQAYKKEIIDEKYKEDINTKVSLQKIKEDLKAEIVLNYARDYYKIDISKFEITKDNKINDKTNKQKPKNIIDFIQTQAKLTSKEAIDIVENLYENIGKSNVEEAIKKYEKIKSNQEKKQEKINENLDIIETEKARKNRDRER